LKRDGRYDFRYFPYEYKSITAKDVLFILCEVLDNIVQNSLSQSNKIVLHGGVMGKNSKAIGFLAKSNTGKSTLLFELSSHDYNYVADDIIIYDYETKGVIPFHIPIKCFLQEKFPHFCKNFSPGTGGEILCQPQQL
jgi:hypothetical protein